MLPPINIGNETQLFVDNYLIELVNFVTKTMHQPVKHPNNPLITKDKPWEILPYFRNNTSVHFDKDEGLYKLWYEDMGWDYKKFMTLQSSSSERDVGQAAGIDSYEKTCFNKLLYAESNDGIKWTKPELNYEKYNDNKTNICLGSKIHGKVHSCSVIYDPIETNIEKKYKAIYWNSKGGLEDTDISSAYSPDGKTWTVSEKPIKIGQLYERQLGDVIILSVNETTREYHLDTRARAMQEPPVNPKHPKVNGWGPSHYPGNKFRASKRRIFSSLTTNWTEWPMLQESLVPDDKLDNIDDEYYGLSRFQIGNLWLGILQIFQRTHNTVDLHLVSSRDGYSWDRVDMTKAFLPTGKIQDWDCFMADFGTRPIIHDDEIRFYYSGSNVHHDWWMFGEMEGLDVPEAKYGFDGKTTALGLATLRKDGFVSIDSTVREGILQTFAVTSTGNKLNINAVCQNNGYLLVEITDHKDNIIDGYSKSECIPFNGNSILHNVNWENKSTIPDNGPDGIKIRFYSRNCSLFSFSFS